MRKLISSVVHEGEKTKGSRFISHVFSLETEKEGKSLLEEIQRKHPKAGHHCYALRLENGVCRCSDDGEPSGSAGMPILRRIESLDLVNVIVIVSRYFGGIKLGIGGLIRAYGGAAAQALALADTVEITEKGKIAICFEYSDSNIVKSIVRTMGDVDIEFEYGQEVCANLFFPLSQGERLKNLLKERSSGRIRIAGPKPNGV